jgi:hypothetical protein
MNKVTKDIGTLKLVKIKQWYLPFDVESYILLKKAGIPLLKFHEDFLPIVQLLCQKNKIKGKLVNWKHSILTPFVIKIGSEFNKNEYCSASINNKIMKFEVNKSSAAQYIKTKVFPRLEEDLINFFNRWGYSQSITYSEHRGKVRLSVNYWLDNNKLPVLPLKEPIYKITPVYLRLGSMRLAFRFGEKWIETVLEIGQGGKFNPYYSSRCLYSQVSSVLPLINALMEVPNKDMYNSDNSIDVI